MSEPFLGEVKIISWNFPPKGWAFCNGQLLPINQNQALFSILGTTYGGDGRVTFALPNLQGRAPVHAGSGIVLGNSVERRHTPSTFPKCRPTTMSPRVPRQPQRSRVLPGTYGPAVVPIRMAPRRTRP